MFLAIKQHVTTNCWCVLLLKYLCYKHKTNSRHPLIRSDNGFPLIPSSSLHCCTACFKLHNKSVTASCSLIHPNSESRQMFHGFCLIHTHAHKPSSPCMCVYTCSVHTSAYKAEAGNGQVISPSQDALTHIIHSQTPLPRGI